MALVTAVLRCEVSLLVPDHAVVEDAAVRRNYTHELRSDLIREAMRSCLDDRLVILAKSDGMEWRVE